MFFHTKQFQYNAKLDNPDPIFAKQMQELLGGQWIILARLEVALVGFDLG